jgi:hypothetical protein
MLTRSIAPRQPQVLVGELSGANTCSLAGTVATGRTPILTACRELLAQGFDLNATIEIYRRDTLALRIRTLAAGARLTVEECSDGCPRFRQYRPRPSEGSPSIAQNADPVAGGRLSWHRGRQRQPQ